MKFLPLSHVMSPCKKKFNFL
uniref:Uncharacterized protein n=1 Tax=Tetranychus urticae TaxID=32264 RepID=T1KM36_TETUR